MAPTPRRWCADCDNFRMHLAWGLCTRCYHRNRRRGTLALYSLGTELSPVELASRIIALRSQAYREREIAELLGIPPSDIYPIIDLLRRKGLLP